MNPTVEQSWRRYAGSCLWFSVLSMLFLYILFRLQNHLPLNPVGLGAVDKYVSFNTAASFITNTNWQAYGGETTMSYLSQMLALTFQNFVSAAVGMAVLVALFRGFVRSKRDEVGNFWRDLVRGTVYILLPLAGIVAVLLVTQGVVQTLGASASATGIQGFGQTIARGPVAGQIAIKQLGTNGGGFFNVNSAHPFEGGIGGFGNFIEMFSILLIPAALTYTFGKWVGNVRQGWALFAVMLVLMVGGLALTVPQEHSASAAMVAAGVPADAQNLEGKELRIGVDESALWAVATTDASNGSVNSMHDSYRPLGGRRADVQHGDRRGDLGRGRQRPVRDALLRDHRRVHRRPDGRPNARVPRQEDRRARGEALGDRRAGPVHPDPRARRGGGRDPGRDGPEAEPGAARLQRDLLRVPLAGEQQRLGLRGDHGERSLLRDLRRPVDARSCGSCRCSRRSRSREASARAGTVPDTSGTLHTDTTLFVVLLTFVIVIIGALTFLPGLALGPIVEHLTSGRLF